MDKPILNFVKLINCHVHLLLILEFRLIFYIDILNLDHLRKDFLLKSIILLWYLIILMIFLYFLELNKKEMVLFLEVNIYYYFDHIYYHIYILKYHIYLLFLF